MCIICNCSDQEEIESGLFFLSSFSDASQQMKKSCDRMLICSKTIGDDDQKKQYGKIHKKMLKIRKMWNQIEHEREIN